MTRKLEVDVQGLQVNMGILKGEVKGLHEDVTELKTDVSGIKGQLSVIVPIIKDTHSCVKRFGQRIAVIETEVAVLKDDKKTVRTGAWGIICAVAGAVIGAIITLASKGE